MKKYPPYNQNTAIRGALRRAFARSPIVREVMFAGRREVVKYNKDGSKAKKPAVQYCCEVCDTWVSSTKIAVDHIVPVISVEDGFVDWNEFVDRLWCDKSNLQRICDNCHQSKTNSERYERMVLSETSFIDEMERSSVLTDEGKKFLKKFTKKRWEKYAYPPEFKSRINSLKLKNGMKV